MGITKTTSGLSKTGGFTVIEVLIVLAIAALILLLIFLALPQAHRNLRNHQRDHDAALIATAINNCVAERGSPDLCKTPDSLDIKPSNLSIFTEYRYHPDDGKGPGYWVLHTDGPVWWFGTRCGGRAVIPDVHYRFTLTYVYEGGGAGLAAKCMDG